MKHLNRKQIVLIAAAVVAIVGVAVGCGIHANNSKHSVNYCGQQLLYKGAEDTFRAGKKVKLYYKTIADDKDYSFTVDDKPVEAEYSDGMGYKIEFVMPDHDITLKCVTNNTYKEDAQSTDDGRYINEQAEDKEETMLVDYYHATVGTMEGNGHYEIVLYTYTDDKAKMNVYTQTDGSPEACIKYIVPYEAVTKCYKLIEKYDFKGWRDLKDNIRSDGAVSVCKFLDENDYVRVSTEDMPEDGEKQIENIRQVMEQYILDEYKVE